jgi:hypothetical protein
MSNCWNTSAMRAPNERMRASVLESPGAGMPTHVKLSPPPGKAIECVIVNGCECEPYLTADHRLMLERADRIVAGRREEPPISAADLAPMVGQGLLTAQGLALLSGGSSSRVYTITATGRAGNDVVHVVRCLVEVSGSGEKGVKMLWWLDKAPRGEGG